mgnify:CR=1 FL=1
MRRLSIDQSYNFCAYIVWNDGEVEQFGVISSKHLEADVFGRARYVAECILDVCDKNDINNINIEGLAFGATGNVARDLAGLLFTIINIVTYKRPATKFELFPPTSVKKIAVGTSKGVDKKQMIAALPHDIRQQFELAGFKKTTGLSDLADAYWIGCCTPV